MDKSELAEMTKKFKRLELELEKEGPKTDDALHAWVVKNMGIDVPRVSVCHDHDAPFQFLADLYFEREGSTILVANRGGSKTFLVAILHCLNSLYKHGCESGTLGAIDQQARRAYEHFQKFIRDPKTGKFIPEVINSTITETKFKGGAKLEVHPATMNTVNGPHWQKVHFDEVELVQDPAVFQESRNISTSKQMPDGRIISAQDIITSTRKYAKGLMQDLLNDVEESKRRGVKPAYRVYKWCIFESAAQVPNCQIGRPDLDEDERCRCDTVAKGKSIRAAFAWGSANL